MSFTPEDKEWLLTKLQGVEDRMAALLAAEVGTIHTELQEMDRRVRRVDTNTITTLELLTRQSRWHEQSDNSISDMAARQSEFSRKLEELRTRIDRLEKAS